MIQLITEDNRVLKNGNFKLNCILTTKCVLGSDNDFLKLRTDDELRRFMHFYKIDRRQYGVVNATFKVTGKIHIALPKGQYGGSYCMSDSDSSILIDKKDVADYPSDRVCKKCLKKVFPPKFKTRVEYLRDLFTKRQLRELRASGSPVTSPEYKYLK